MDLNIRRAQYPKLASLLTLRWIPFIHSKASLEGSVVRKRHFLITTKHDLHAASAIRVIGDSHGGVVMQAHWENAPRHFTLQLLRNDHFGMSTISEDALDALAKVVDVIDLRDEKDIWPDRVGARHGDRARKPTRLTRASIHGRRNVAELFRKHIDFVRANGDLKASPLAGIRFTSASIAAAMAAAYEPVMMESVTPLTAAESQIV